MSWLGDVLDFEKFNGKKIFGGIAKDPSRLLTGIDPASTGLWNTVTGSHKHALVDQMGGARGETYKEASDAGINTKPGRFMQNIAHVVAGAYGAAGLAGAAGAAGAGGAGEAGVGASGTDVGGLEALDSAAVSAEGAEPALLGGEAVGAGSTADVAGLEAADSAAVDAEGAEPALMGNGGPASSSSSSSYLKKTQQIGKLMQQQAQQQRQRELEASRVNVEAPALQNPYATSSKAMKTAPTGNVEAALVRGATGADAIDTNGVQSAAIQEISKRLTAAKARLAELQRGQQ